MDKIIRTLVATECACCRRPLTDSVSVEIGMGPRCREQHLIQIEDPTVGQVAAALGHLLISGMDNASITEAGSLSDNPRKFCNFLVWWVSTHLDEVDKVLNVSTVLGNLGFTSLAGNIQSLHTDVRIVEGGDSLTMWCRSTAHVRKNMDLLDSATPVAREGRFRYGWKFPASQRNLVLTILGEDFGGHWACLVDEKHATRIVKITPTTTRQVRACLKAGAPKANATIQVDYQKFVVRVFTPKFSQLFVDEIKSLPPSLRKWNPAHRCWEVSASYESRVRDLVAIYF